MSNMKSGLILLVAVALVMISTMPFSHGLTDDQDGMLFYTYVLFIYDSHL